MLRNQITESKAQYVPPVLGVHLRASEHDLQPGEARLMQNCEFYGGIRIRRGSQRLTPNSLFTTRGLGGHKYYFGGPNPQNTRLIAYSNRISAIDGVGTQLILTTGMTPNLDTYFTTWPITDSVYISNAADTLRRYDGNSVTFSTLTGTNIPIPRTAVVPIVDRLLAITNNGIERTSPRVDNVWSQNSGWATFRPGRPGLFTAMAPYALTGVDTIHDGIIALQERAYYHIGGTDFGNDASAATASTGEDGSIQLLDPTVGTASPDSLVNVPGVGLFWFTTDLNVFWLPVGTLTGKYVGDKLLSTNITPGTESTNPAALKQVWMTYYDHILMLGIPMGSNNYSSVQYWMDMRVLRDKGIPVWYGPMTGQTIAKSWVENQQGDNALYGLEGNAPSNGLFVYQLRVPSRFSDAVGLNDIPINMVYQSMFMDFGAPSREKYLQAVHLDINQFMGTATVDLLTLDGTIATGISVDAVNE